MSAAGQGASFDELHAKMKGPLKPNNRDPGSRLMTRRLLRELEEDGYIAEEDGRWRFAANDDMREVFLALTLSVDNDRDSIYANSLRIAGLPPVA